MRSLGPLGLLLLVVGSQAGAATIRVSLTGTIDSVDFQLVSGPFAVGDPVSVSFEVDSTTPDAVPDDPSWGYYIGAVSSLSITFGGYTGTGTGENSLTVEDNRGAPPFVVEAFAVQSEITGDGVAGFPPSHVLFYMFADTTTVFSSDAIPATLDLADFLDPTVVLAFADEQDFIVLDVIVAATVESLSYPVAEPDVLTLLLLGVLGAAAAPRRMRR